MSCCVAKLAVRDRVLFAVRWMGSAHTGPMNLRPGRRSRGSQLVTDDTREEEDAMSISKMKSACDSWACGANEWRDVHSANRPGSGKSVREVEQRTQGIYNGHVSLHGATLAMEGVLGASSEKHNTMCAPKPMLRSIRSACVAEQQDLG